jgi:hypothetical protein
MKIKLSHLRKIIREEIKDVYDEEEENDVFGKEKKDDWISHFIDSLIFERS